MGASPIASIAAISTRLTRCRWFATSLFTPRAADGSLDDPLAANSQNDGEADAVPAPTSPARVRDGAISGLERTRTAVDDHIRALYAGLGEPQSHASPPYSRDVAAPELMPPSW